MEWIRAASRKKKVSLLLLLAVLCIACMPLTAFAHETTLTTTVPSQCPMKIEIVGNGKVNVEGVSYTETSIVQVKRHTEVEFVIIPDRGYVLQAVSYDGEDVLSKIHDNTLVLPEVSEDSILKVVFEENGTVPKTGEYRSSLWIYALLMLVTGIGIAFSARKTRTEE